MEHVSLKCYRVVKRVPKKQETYRQIMNEVVILKGLSHPCIPIIYDIEEDDYYSYIIEEYIMGESLRTYRLNQKNISQSTILNYSIQICDLIQFLHSEKNGILYLDVKPDNFIVFQDKLRLVDFGASRYFNEQGGYYSFGTRGYAAPEQYGDARSLDQRSDIYSIGKLLYFMVTGEQLRNESEVKKRAGFFLKSKKLYRIVATCISEEPSKRYQSVARLKDDLEELYKGTNKKINSFRPLTIAIGGSQKRIGCTHIAMFLAKYFSAMYHNVLFVSVDDSKIVECLTAGERKGEWKNNILKVGSLSYTQSAWVTDRDLARYLIQIRDYGMITESNRAAFLNEEYKIFVMGNKPWELPFTMESVKRISGNGHILYAMNSCENKEADSLISFLTQENVFYIPFLGDPLGRKVEKEGCNFGKEVFAWINRNQ